MNIQLLFHLRWGGNPAYLVGRREKQNPLTLGSQFADGCVSLTSKISVLPALHFNNLIKHLLALQRRWVTRTGLPSGQQRDPPKSPSDEKDPRTIYYRNNYLSVI